MSDKSNRVSVTERLSKSFVLAEHIFNESMCVLSICTVQTRTHTFSRIQYSIMSKRPAEQLWNEADALKGGQRPLNGENGEELEFEDEFEDEFESEDEIFEAGVDGRPDEEREAEEKAGMWITPYALCECLPYRS